MTRSRVPPTPRAGHTIGHVLVHDRPHPCPARERPLAGAAMRPPVPAARRRGAEVLRMAHRLRARTPAQARGRCLALSLELCRQAQAQGIETQLVVWTVVGDPEFCDHWAVMLEDRTIVDLTHIQVDGSARLTARMQDYPTHFRRPHAYPAGLLLPTYECDRDRERRLLSSKCLLKIRWLLVSHDVAQALRCRSLLQVAEGLASLAKFAARHAVDRSLRRLYARREALRARRPVDTEMAPLRGATSD